MATLEHWIEWKTTCALALCGAAARNDLEAFARSRFSRFAAAYADAVNDPDPNALVTDGAEAWHLFETCSRLRNTRQGKSYKQWLLARSGGDVSRECIEGGATLLIRDAARERFRREFPARNMLALDALVETDGGGRTVTVDELLPSDEDTAGDVGRRELEGMAAAEAARALTALNFRQKIAFFAREAGVSLAHPAVTSAAGCGKSVLFKAYGDALAALADRVRERYPDEDKSDLALIAIYLLENLRALVVSWAMSETALSCFFRPAAAPGGTRAVAPVIAIAGRRGMGG